MANHSCELDSWNNSTSLSHLMTIWSIPFCYRSAEVENKLERECGQVYSPVRNYKYFQQQPSSKYPGGEDDDEQQKAKQHSFKYQSHQAQPQPQAPQINQAHNNQREPANKDSGRYWLFIRPYHLNCCCNIFVLCLYYIRLFEFPSEATTTTATTTT